MVITFNIYHSVGNNERAQYDFVLRPPHSRNGLASLEKDPLLHFPSKASIFHGLQLRCRFRVQGQGSAAASYREGSPVNVVGTGREN